MKAEENKKKVELNDEQLNDVAGGGNMILERQINKINK
jgi:hypothetical protein